MNDTNAWLTIDQRNIVTIYSGKVELGTGTQTAFMQIVADELYVDMSAIEFIQGVTNLTPNQGFTAGSKSVQVQGPLLRRAAAMAFQQLLTLASGQLGVPFNRLYASGGQIGIGPNMTQATKYAALFAGQQIPPLYSDPLSPPPPLKDPGTYTVVGQPTPRVDLVEKCTGVFPYISDKFLDGTLPGMLHGRVMRNNFVTVNSTTIPPTKAYVPKPKNATFGSYDPASLAAIGSDVQVLRKQNFIGVVATTEWAAIKAARTLLVNWNAGHALVSDSTPGDVNTPGTVQYALTHNVVAPNKAQETVGDAVAAFNTAATKVTETFYTPYQMHASVGPTCAVADVKAAPDPTTGIQATVWSGTQGVYNLKGAVADVLGIAQTAVQVIYVEGAGCYGHNGADDVAVDAALMSQLAGAPVRVQWMRQDEHGWEPLGPAMLHQLQGGLEKQGKVVSWQHTVFTPPHNSRPGGNSPPGRGWNLLAGQELGNIPSQTTANVNLGTRNAPVNYSFPNMNTIGNFVSSYTTTGELVNILPRSTALRSLGGMSNTFANESFMDELALKAHADPIQYRRGYVCALSGDSGTAQSAPVPGVDHRAVAVLDAVRQRSGWDAPLAPAPAGAKAGRGVAYVRYETVETYVAACVEVEVTTSDPANSSDPPKGAVRVRRVVVAHDCGLIVNPDGLRNQIEGNVIQGISRALIEQVQFDTNGVTSLLWAPQPGNPAPAYPVIHFNQVPDSIEIALLDHPEQLLQTPDLASWGAGEPTIEAIPAAIGNAIFNAVGVRVTSLPIGTLAL